MLIVISPAKKLDYSGAVTAPLSTQPALLNHAEELLVDLKTLAPQAISSLMSLSDNLGALNYERFQAWQTPFTEDNARPAMLAFKGDVYQGLDADSMSADDMRWAQDHLRILSGLYGVLRPLDELTDDAEPVKPSPVATVLTQQFGFKDSKEKLERLRLPLEKLSPAAADEVNEQNLSDGGDDIAQYAAASLAQVKTENFDSILKSNLTLNDSTVSEAEETKEILQPKRTRRKKSRAGS